MKRLVEMNFLAGCTRTAAAAQRIIFQNLDSAPRRGGNSATESCDPSCSTRRRLKRTTRFGLRREVLDPLRQPLPEVRSAFRANTPLADPQKQAAILTLR